MALSLRISFNRNSEGWDVPAILVAVSVIVCIFYWLAALLALTLGSAMCGQNWAWFW